MTLADAASGIAGLGLFRGVVRVDEVQHRVGKAAGEPGEFDAIALVPVGVCLVPHPRSACRAFASSLR